MPATAAAVAVQAEHLTLVEAAREIFPHARGNSGYHRLRMMISRHRCPIQFSYGRNAKNRSTRYLQRDQLDTLKQWVKDLS